MANAIIKTVKAYKTTPISKMRNQILKKKNKQFGKQAWFVNGCCRRFMKGSVRDRQSFSLSRFCLGQRRETFASKEV